MARDVKLLIEFLRQKHEQRNPEDTRAKELNEYLFKFILSVKRKDGKDFEPLALSIDVWKNVNIPSVSSTTLLLNAKENVLKLKTSNLKRRAKATDLMQQKH